MTDQPPVPMPSQCPACAAPLRVTRLACPACGTEVAGVFATGRLVHAPEPHASLLELYLRLRGNAKEMERALGVSYPTVRARLDEAFAAIARPEPPSQAAPPARGATADRSRVRERQLTLLDALERGDITATEAVARLRGHRPNR